MNKVNFLIVASISVTLLNFSQNSFAREIKDIESVSQVSEEFYKVKKRFNGVHPSDMMQPGLPVIHDSDDFESENNMTINLQNSYNKQEFVRFEIREVSDKILDFNDYEEEGMASWYGDDFHGKKTANDEVYSKNCITAAHKTLPLPSIVRVTNLENGKTLIVKVNDRGPFAGNRIIDLSESAAKILGYHDQGIAKVKVVFLKRETEALKKSTTSNL